MIATPVKAHSHKWVRDTVVTLATEPIRVPAPEGDLPASAKLGPGSIRSTGVDGLVQVHWIERNFDAWMDPADLHMLDPASRLISVFHCNAEGQRTFGRHKLVISKGLQYNWIVERLPEDVMRTVRSDGAAWTWNWHPILHMVEVLHTVGYGPVEDDDAEARVVAEMAVGIGK